jgi:uncharacterized membrane protein
MKLIFLYTMAVLYIAAGISHFVNQRFYKKIMPPWLPWHKELVYISGVLEIILGLLLFPESTRVIASWAIIGLLVSVFPANIQMMLNYRRKQHPYFWLTVLRLPLQLVLIYWAWQFT